MKKVIMLFVIMVLTLMLMEKSYAGGYEKFDGYTKYAEVILSINNNEVKIEEYGTFKITEKTNFCIDETLVKSFNKIKDIKEGTITVDDASGIVLEINDKLPSISFNNGTFDAIYPKCNAK